MIKHSKLGSILLSLAIAFGLWLYVVTNVSVEGETTFHDISVQFVGETALENRGYVITSGMDASVDLRLQGARTNLNKLTSSSISIKVDLSRIYDPGTHKVEYDIIYPGDVPNNAFTVLNKVPASVTVTVEELEQKEIPVVVRYEGSVPEDYLDDRDNVLLDYQSIAIKGPTSVVSRIDRAEVTVNLKDRTESISQKYPYILCDQQGEPVDAALVVAETAEVRLDLTILRFKELPVIYDLVTGGGASADDVTITPDISSIRVSGSNAVLEKLTAVDLGTINLAHIEEDTRLTIPVELPAGVLNLTGVEEINVDVKFNGLTTREFTVENIRVAGVPAGMTYELVTKRLTVTVRGPSSVVKQMTAQDLQVTADVTGKPEGTVIVNATVSVTDPAYNAVGALGNVSVSVTLRTAAEGNG